MSKRPTIMSFAQGLLLVLSLALVIIGWSARAGFLQQNAARRPHADASSRGNASDAVAQGSTGALKPPLCGKADDAQPHLPADSEGLPNWDTFVAPPRGGSYRDPVFGCTITRLTEDSTSYHDYSTTQAMNASDTLVLVGRNGQMRVLDLRGGTVVDEAHMPAHNNGHYLWDTRDGNKFYFAVRNLLMSAIIKGRNSLATATVHKFDEYPRWITIMDYANVSQDGDHMALVGENPAAQKLATIDFFVFQLSNNSKAYVFNSSPNGCVVSNAPAELGGQPGEDCMHKLLLTGDNKPVMEWHANQDPKMPPGCVAAFAAGAGCKSVTEKDGTLRLLQSGTTHMDTGFDLTGTKSIIVENFDPDPNGTHQHDPCYNHGGISIKEVDSLALRCLVSTDFRSGHVSFFGGPKQPWVAIDVEDDRVPGPEWYNTHSGNYVAPLRPCLQLEGVRIEPSCWTLYEDEIMLVRVDGDGNINHLGGTNGKTYRLAHSRSRQAEEYYAEPRASLSRDGRYVVFDSNMAHADGNCAGRASNGCVDVYLLGPVF